MKNPFRAIAGLFRRKETRIQQQKPLPTHSSYHAPKLTTHTSVKRKNARKSVRRTKRVKKVFTHTSHAPKVLQAIENGATNARQVSNAIGLSATHVKVLIRQLRRQGNIQLIQDTPNFLYTRKNTPMAYSKAA